MNVEPSALREVLITQPKETWDDIGGLNDAINQLREVVEWPLKYPDLYGHLNSKPPKGILLYGPPGTGKTLIAKALANESEVNFISVKGPEFLSKWVGESEKAVRETFRKARSAAPCIIFFDEIDAIAGVRGRSAGSTVTEQVISQLLTEMDGLEGLEDVILLAATNRADMLDPALLRAGRFGRHIEIPMPEEEARREIFKIHLRDKPLDDDVSIKEMAKQLDGYTGADIASVCEEATLMTIRRVVNDPSLKTYDKDSVKDVKISKKEFNIAIKKVLKSAKKAQKAQKMMYDKKPSEDLYR
jgi:transitional endoplasmic reticulum ATPase